MNIRVQGQEAAPFQKVAIPPEAQTIKIERTVFKGKNVWQVRGPRHGDDAAVKIIDSPYLMLQGQHLQSDGHYLPQQIFLAGAKQFDVIGIVPLEDYVAGVVSNEMPPSWPEEALKAQAIAARSYALALMRERSHALWHVENSVLDQVYKHFGASQEEEKKTKIDRVIEETRGLVLLNKKDRLLKAFYHSDCGGRTASSQSVWGTKELVGGVVDSSCPRNPASIWNYQVSEEEFAQKLGVPGSKLVAMNMDKSPQDGRVHKIRVHLGEGKYKEINANHLRQMVGFNALRSTNFSVKKVGSQLIFDGKGFGHGVGMCQWGSRVMAERGAKFRSILSHYYPEAQIKTY